MTQAKQDNPKQTFTPVASREPHRLIPSAFKGGCPTCSHGKGFNCKSCWGTK
jgi:hypothetical protein